MLVCVPVYLTLIKCQGFFVFCDCNILDHFTGILPFLYRPILFHNHEHNLYISAFL